MGNVIPLHKSRTAVPLELAILLGFALTAILQWTGCLAMYLSASIPFAVSAKAALGQLLYVERYSLLTQGLLTSYLLYRSK